MNEAPTAAVISTGKSKMRFGSGHPVNAAIAATPRAAAPKTAANDP
jgi:hypothetical protein